ncbi:WRKY TRANSCRIPTION FACTOR WRKY24-LIKE [Salix koriyanagi]|uniref:WRKY TRANSCRIPTION FACTOR WRKY24-LIKE n=1 Tax=Salix koriyanagi TaxID=2511006 RepID=A0A9Q1A4P6_9ROSI|nr:WRKY TRANSCRIPTION FACTOR WRKY24-LIKE [Salix koriyanagi]
MAASSGSLDTSGNSHPQSSSNYFSFSTNSSNHYPFMTSSSFTDLLVSNDEKTISSTTRNSKLADRIAERTGSGVPKFKSIPPPSLPLSPPPVSPSYYFAIPPGLSPTELLDSPVLLNPSNILPSPTTGSFPGQGLNWKSSSGNTQKNVKKEDGNFSDFSFQQPARPSTTSSAMFQSSNSTVQPGQQQTWGFQEPAKQDEFVSGKSNMVKMEYNSNSIKNFSPEIAAIQANPQSNNGFQSDYGNQQQQYQSVREQKRSDDGYNWRNGQMDSSVATPDNSSISIGDDDFDSQRSKSMGGDDLEEDEPEAKRWKRERDNEGISAPGSRTGELSGPRLLSLYMMVLAALSCNNGSNNGNNNAAMAVRPSTVNHVSNNSINNPTRNQGAPPSTTSEGDMPFTLEMLQSPGSFGFLRIRKPDGVLHESIINR